MINQLIFLKPTRLFSLKVLLSFCVFLANLKPRVAYESVPYKKCATERFYAI